ncbi:MAG: DEAD/DEAH box helicase [Anaerolineae bacterium]|nr:DEAD/DEAH box helicase [Anaerolineae bacterium]NUQ04749.1 DEAD/DEAH box helicase [Anaerolineae bacterium]
MFEVGEIVSLKVDSSRQGPIIEILSQVAGKTRYRVFHSPADMPIYFEDQIVSASGEVADPLVDALLNGRWVSPETFRARLTAARLAHPQTDHVYALHAARVKYVPFQFKPLLRLLRSDRPRLLIADEVGVGKTIEAGLILKELQSRQQVDKVLIICPKALVQKWRAEMRRFDEDFQILAPETLQYCISETNLDGVWPAQYRRAIVNLELIRSDAVLAGNDRKKGLLTLSPPPQFSLIIVDEAHHLRNPQTNSYEVARYLCDVGDAVLFLSATPIQTASHNLFALLHLLRPDLFQDFGVFQAMVEPNQHINQAIRAIRGSHAHLSWQEDVRSAFQSAVATEWGRQILATDENYMFWRDRMADTTPLSDWERVRCLRDLEEMHTLAHLVNRTRRRDIGRFTIREPRTIAVPFTSAQQAFYEALIEFRRDLYALAYGEQVARMITDTLERQASSCLPAMASSLESLVRGSAFSVSTLTDDTESDDTAFVELAPVLARLKHLQELATGLQDEDPKLDQLTEIVDRALADPGSGKVLLFSFFLHTLEYLKRRLSRRGYRVELITGKTPDHERELLRNRFAQPREYLDTVDMLLSSEVGCEGLDYQFCDRLVNYDIPWNPMRVEQRIGRIDRYGQLSDKVLIYNFITPGTVEERIYFRCFDRLGIFNDTLGDLEEIMGQVMDELDDAALSIYLSPEQSEAKALQTADNTIRLAEEQRRIEDAGYVSFSLEQSFADDIARLEAEGKFVSPTDLRQMVGEFLEDSVLGGRLTPDPQNTSGYKIRLARDSRGKLIDQMRTMQLYGRSAQIFRRWLESDEASITVTFDQNTASDFRYMEFITPLHPLTRIAVAAQNAVVDPLVTSVLTTGDASGNFLIAYDIWESIAVQSDLRLVALAWDLDTNMPVSGGHAEALSRLIHEADYAPYQVTQQLKERFQQAILHIDEYLYQMRQSDLSELQIRNRKLLARRLGSLDSYYQRRKDRVHADLEQATEPRIQRMKKSELQRVEHEYAARRKEIEARGNADIITKRIALAVLTIEAQ